MSKTYTQPDNLYSVDRELVAAGVPERDAQYLRELYRQHHHVAEQLDRMAVHVADKMEGVRAHLGEGLSVNSLGELQSNGPELDRLCTQYHDTAETMTKAIFYVIDDEALQLTAKAILFPQAQS